MGSSQTRPSVSADDNLITVEDDTQKNMWLLRGCDYYKTEYESCNAYKSRLFQMFVHGHKLDCSKWQDYYHSCMKFEESKNEEDVIDLIQAETHRREEQMKGAQANDIWEYRDIPPENWNQPWDRSDYVKRHKSTFFGIYIQHCYGDEQKDGKTSEAKKLTPDIIKKGPKVTTFT